MKIRDESIDQLLQARSEIDEELECRKTKQTVLFTDIVGSTTYFDRFGDTEGLLLLFRHHSLVTDAVTEFKGIVVKTIGDSVMAEFGSSLSAVHAAIGIQRRLLHYNLRHQENERLQIRIGIHAGSGLRHANDLFGDSVNVAARITKLSGPAQILVSQSVSQAIPAAEISFRSLGIVNLEGKKDPEELFEVFWTDTDAYEELRSSLITVSSKGGGVSDAVPLINDRQVKSNDGSAIAGFAPSKARRVLSILVDRIVLAIRESWSLPILKTATVFVAYLMISAGIVVSRTDTRKTTVGAVPAPTTEEAMDSAKTETGKSSFAQGVIAPPGSENAMSGSVYPLQSFASATASEPKPDKAQIPEPVGKPSLLKIVSDIKPAPMDQRPKWMTLIETVPIPAGIFSMGNETGKGDEKPQHQVRLDGFNMSRTEITNRQYFAFLEDTGYPRPRDPAYMKNYLMDAPDLPVVNVSYADAVAFCAWASTRFNAAIGLPTEAQWEYAAVAGKNVGPFPSGAKARFKANAPRGVKTVAGDAFPPNRFGLYNMMGNVSEWVLDYYSKDYYTTSPIRNPKGPISGTRRSIRGGSWADDEAALWATRRSSQSPGYIGDEVGFRIVASDSRHPTPAQ